MASESCVLGLPPVSDQS